MDSGPTLDIDVIDGPFDDYCDNDDEVWGRIFPLRKEFFAQNLVKDEYTFGRGEECDYCFDLSGRKNPHFLALSKTHFRIYREKDKNDPTTHLVFIQDKSSNGTFVNGDKIGKNKKQVLNSNDDISLATKTNRAFIFHDCGCSSDLDSLPKEFNNKYTMSKPLGRGMCGEVKLAFEKESCRKCAVKIISKKTFSFGPLGRAAKDEVQILRALKHPCIIRIEDVIESQDALYIVLELAEGGELFDRVVDSGKFSESLAKLYFYQLLVSVKYLHARGITHRDLKPENVLLANDDMETLIKVTDFGLSKFVGENSLMKTLCGTPSYLAPEVLQTAGTGGYNKAVDCWSMGVILFIMLGGYPPFSSEITTCSLHDQICKARYSFPEKYWKDVSGDAIDMIKQLLTLDPKKRISTSAALDHPWMRDSDVIAKAHKLMGDDSSERGLPANEPMSPPMTSPSRKRTAPTSFSDDDEQTNKPAKRTTIDTLSPNDTPATSAKDVPALSDAMHTCEPGPPSTSVSQLCV